MNENNPYYCSFVGVDYIICECGDNFANEDDLKVHLEIDRFQHQSKINGNDLTEINIYSCGTCDEIFNTAEECMSHQDLIHVGVVTKVEEDTEDVGEYKHATVKQENNYDSYSIKDNYTNPPLRVQSIPVKVKKEIVEDEVEVELKYDDESDDNHDDEPFVKCEDIADEELYSFIPRSDYLNNFWRVRSVKPKAEVLKERKEKKKKKKTNLYNSYDVVCEVCGKKYASKMALRYHQRVHTGVRPYACLYCPKTFTMPLFQQIHTRIHTGEKPYQCSACPKAFTNKAALLRHDRVHTGEKPYECPKCGKSFSQSNSMKLHVRTVHLKLPAPYKSKRRRAQQGQAVVYSEDFKTVEGIYSGDFDTTEGVQYCVIDESQDANEIRKWPTIVKSSA